MAIDSIRKSNKVIKMLVWVKANEHSLRETALIFFALALFMGIVWISGKDVEPIVFTLGSICTLLFTRPCHRSIRTASSEVVRNTIVTASARYYKKFSGHTVATRLSTKLGYELDSSKQFSLGADSGLRGYPARQFTGERQLLMNLEDRQFWGSVSIGPEIEVGTVLFVDSGNVWKEEQEIDLDDMNWSTGFGFRLGFSNMPKQPIFRIDFGWSIGSEDDNNFAVTVGQEQQF